MSFIRPRTDHILHNLGVVSLNLDVSVRNVDVVEKVNGRADVPHYLRSLWEEKRKTHSLKPEAVPVSHNKRFFFFFSNMCVLCHTFLGMIAHYFSLSSCDVFITSGGM